MAQTDDQDRTLLAILLVLTLFSGFIDAGGHDALVGRRVAAVGAMLVGALVGAPAICISAPDRPWSPTRQAS